jgi:hypothetical protein
VTREEGLDLAVLELAASPAVAAAGRSLRRPGFTEEVRRAYAYQCAMCGFGGALGRVRVSSLYVARSDAGRRAAGDLSGQPLLAPRPGQPVAEANHVGQWGKFTHSAAGNYALSRALTWVVGGNRAGRPATTFPAPWSSALHRRLRVRVEACRSRPAPIIGDLQVGSAFKAPGPLPGTFSPGRGAVLHAAVATVSRHSRGEVCGSTRPAPDGRSPYRPAEAAKRPPPRRCRPGACPNRP